MLVAFVALSLSLTGCAGSDTTATTEPPTATIPTGSQVALLRSNDTLLVDRSLRLTAFVPASVGTGLVPVWNSSDTTVAVVTQGGLVFALKSGSAKISVSVGNSTASTRLAVRPSLRSLRFQADTLALGLDQAVDLPYRAIDSDGNTMDLSRYSVQWSSSDPEIAPVSGSGGITGRLLGATSVGLSVDGQASFIRVEVRPPNVSNVTITPSSVAPTVGEQIQLSAVATDPNGAELRNRIITWSSSNQAVATVSTSGLLTAVAAGNAKITAVCDNKRSFLSFTVRQPGTPTPVDSGTTTTTVVPVSSVTVSLAPTTIVIGQTAQATAVVKDSSSNVLTGRQVSWTSSDASVASVSDAGVVSGLKAGSAVITGSVDGKAANAVVVVAAPLLAPKTITVVARSPLKVGELAQSTAIVKDINGTIIPDAPVTWTSTPSSVVAVSANGMTIGQSAGTGSVSASVSGISQSATVTVVDTTTVSAPLIGVLIQPGQSIQSAVNANPTGTTFVIAAGTHTNQSVIPKAGDRFMCQPGAILDGGRSTAQAFYVTSAALPANVTVDGCIVQNYNSAAQVGAISAGTTGSDAASRWTITNNEVRENGGIGIRIGHYAQVLNNRVHHNWQLGIGGVGDSALVENNEIAFNNYLKKYDFGWEAGGTKFVMTRNLVVRGNYVHDNWGPGLWTDIDNIGTLYENNRILNNADAGIFHEISYRAVIRNNEIRGNGAAAPAGWLWGAGIQIAASPDVEIYGNTLSGNANGIAGIQQNRGSGAYGTHLVQNLYVHDNTVDVSSRGQSGVVHDYYDDAIFTGWNNRFAANHYTLGTNAYPFAWANAGRSVTQWKGYGQDVSGTFAP